MSYGSVPPPPIAPGQAPYSAAPQPPLSNKKLKWIILAVVLAFLLLIGLFVGGLLAVIFGALKSSEPYQHAVQTATHDPRVLASLGAPVKPGWLPSGSIHVSGPSGNADLALSLQGTARKGTLYVVAKKSAGRWTYQTLELRVEGEPDLDLLQPPGAAPAEKEER